MTASVPASVRARSSASAFAAWSTSGSASSIEWVSNGSDSRRTSITTATISPESVIGSSSAPWTTPLSSSRGMLRASSRPSAIT
ncbi:MAG: hypothetical protein E6G62_06175 [Actinobacteria bacterium]|nr:MAG: hypothetical protein E6G62_06175 [Actinomycetota bacterium]